MSFSLCWFYRFMPILLCGIFYCLRQKNKIRFRVSFPNGKKLLLCRFLVSFCRLSLLLSLFLFLWFGGIGGGVSGLPPAYQYIWFNILSIIGTDKQRLSVQLPHCDQSPVFLSISKRVRVLSVR